MLNFLTSLFTRENRGRILTIIFSVFGFFYHLCFLFVFKTYRIAPMYYFNFISVGVFLSLSLVVILKKQNALPFFAALIEVAIHQILADYFVGVNAAFHYFIIATGLLTLLVFNKHIFLATLYSLFSLVLFVCIEKYLSPVLPPFILPRRVLANIRIVNISMGLSIILLGVFISTFLINRIEDNLEIQVEEKTNKLEERNHRVSILQDHIIVSLANLVENRDHDTGEHIQRTSAYVELISSKALEKNLYPEIITEDFIDTIKRAAPMHDIGKIVVPDSILQKPGKLTDEEFAQMQRHTTEGRKIIYDTIGISEDRNFIKMASDIALCHHERWDGKGYPKHFKGTEIPVSARIMAIADVFDALVSKRCYKDPMPLDKAFQLISEEKNCHFDPDFADIFIENRSEVEIIFNKYVK